MKPKTNPLVSGAAFLAVTGILVKILGLVFKIPLVYIIGEDGMGYFNSAYTIYNLFFILGSAGLPVAISILVSEDSEKNNANGVWRLFRILISAVAIVGGAGCVVLLAGAKGLSMLIGNAQADLCIAVMAPVFLFVCVSGGLRGYFQGMSRMMPTGISQLIEALGKTCLGVGFALLAVKKGYSLPVCAAFSLAGIAVGSFFSMAYLFILATLRRKGSKEKTTEKIRRNTVLKRMVGIALPVTLGSLVLSLSNFIDLTAIMRGLLKLGLDTEQANRLYGNYTALAVPMFNLPPVVILPIAYAAVPAVTAAKSKGDRAQMGRIASASLKAASLITLPSMLALALFARPILTLLFEREAALRAAPSLTLLAPALFFVGIVTVTNSLLQASGNPFLPVVSMLAGGLAKLAISLWLIPKLGIAGAPIGTFVCYAVIAVINLCFAHRHCRLSLQFGQLFWAPLGAAGVACLAGKAAGLLFDGRMSTLLSLSATAIVYVLLLVICGILGSEEIAALPIPQAVKKIIIKKETKHEKRPRTERSDQIRL